MKRALIGFVLLLGAAVARAQSTPDSTADTINQRIFLIGDAGDMYGSTHPVIDWLKRHVDWNDERNNVIYLGDNIYPLGLPMEGEPSYPLSKAILDDQISLVKGKKAKGFFVMGNHDWRNGKLGGWEQAINQQDYINGLGEKNIQAWPINGCPGPVEQELSDKVVLVFVDSQWFLFLHDKPGPSSNCTAKTIDEFAIELGEIIASHPNQMVILATHHPLYSYGIHGGDFGFKEHIFPFTAINPNLYIPLPVLGSVYPLARGVFGSVQDIPHPLYKGMINTIEEVIKKHPNAISVAGHDHGLQFIMKDSIAYVVSGSGSVLSRIKPGRFSKFSDVNFGFAMIEVWKSGKSDIRYYNLQSKDLSAPTFTADLKTIQKVTPTATLDTTRPVLEKYVTVAANPKLNGTRFSRFMVGDNYRAEWTQPVTVPVLDLTKERGGLTPEKQGGGKQTKSLRVTDSTGRQFALRSVEKFPDAAIPPDLRQTFVNDIVEDGISASYPYGVLSMERFSKAAGVPYLKNRLVYLPDDPRLDRFRANFKNMLALMEEREPEDVKKDYDTDELVLRLAKDNDDHVDQKAVLKARLLDMFVMDFDRHEGQWIWSTRDTGKGKLYYPIPKDRDQVFYTNQGIIPYFVKKPWLVPELQGFKAEAKNIKTFNRAARNFDRTFLTDLDESEWTTAIDAFLSTMTDAVIEEALSAQPKEIQRHSAQDIISTLKERRQFFKDEMMEYYRFISKSVSVVGSNQRERFMVDRMQDGKVRVMVNKIDKDSNITSLMYDRIFDPSITKEINLFGLKDDDVFQINGESSPIRIRTIGGSGNDNFVSNSSGKKVIAYDVSFEQNKFTGDNGFLKRVFPNPQVNRYDRLNFKYDVFHPGLSFEYNIDDGLFLGPKLEFIHQGFRKEPYSFRQYVAGRRAFKTNSYHFIYEGDFIKVLRNTDLIVRGDFRAPVNVTNFFGLGNDTKIDNTIPDKVGNYRARYNIINISTYFSRQLQSWMRVNVGPTFQYFRLDSAQNVGKYVSQAPFNGLDRFKLFDPAHFLGIDARMYIDSRNNKVVPTRGLALEMGVRPLWGLDQQRNRLVQANIDMRIFMNLAALPRFVLATRFGYGENFGEYQFPQAYYLSGVDNLRGYRRQRFGGKGMLFNNTEIRFTVANFNTYLFPGSVGIIAFNDIGKVWVSYQNSAKWHDGYGFGIFIAPIKRVVLTGMLGYSEEEKGIPRITAGFQF